MSSIRLFAGLFCFIAVTVTAIAAGSDKLSGYRLSGTINKSNSSWLALVEDSSGEQHLVRVGDLLADASVIDIGNNTIRLAIGEQGWILNLEGLVETGPLVVSKLPAGSKPTATIRAELSALAAKTNIRSQTAFAEGVTGNAQPEMTSQTAASGVGSPGSMSVGGGLMGSTQSTPSGTSTPQTSRSNTNTDSESTSVPEAVDSSSNNPSTFEPESNNPEVTTPSIETELRRILNLPPDTNIVSIDHQPVNMSEQTLDLLNQSLDTTQENGTLVRIGIKTEDGDSAIYLLPEDGAGNAI